MAEVGGSGVAPGKQTLEEITLGVLEELGAAVRPARYVPNEDALEDVLEQLRSADPPKELDMEWYSIGDHEVSGCLSPEGGGAYTCANQASSSCCIVTFWMGGSADGVWTWCGRSLVSLFVADGGL